MKAIFARVALTTASLCLLGGAGMSPSAAADPAPAWSIQVIAAPANIAPGGSGKLLARATNVGGAPAGAHATIEAVLPPGLTPSAPGLGGSGQTLNGTCTVSAPVVSCETSDALGPSEAMTLEATVQAAPSVPAGPVIAATARGGGAAEATSAMSVAIQSGAVPFGFVNPLQAPLTTESGSAAILAGSHPYQQTVSFDFPTQILQNRLIGAGHVRDVQLDLPAGLIGNPSATPVLCTEAELEGANSCPDASVVGILDIPAVLGGFGLSSTPLFNMVPPPGYPAELATNLAEIGIFAHLLPSVRSEGDYGVSVSVPDVLALTSQPLFGSTSEIWGDPSSPTHDLNRGHCLPDSSATPCPVEEQSTAFWTLPSRCDGEPLKTVVSADSWEEPGLFHHSAYQSADLGGNPVSLSDCAALQFEPTIEAKPTTSLADSPSGLDFDLHQPQDDELAQRANPPLRDATVTLPAGMTVNPSQADGLGVCTEQQIGFLAEDEEPGNHFSKQPNSCPDAAKLGTVEVTTPLLAQRDASQHLELDPETGRPIPRPLHGTLYLAKPFDNPFDSLLAIYLTVEDPQSGTIAKLAGRIQPDSQTGRLTTVFEENPQLPIEDIRLHIFGGARGALITPLTCGAHATTTDLMPWSAPDTPDAHPVSSFQTTTEPGGGSCPSSDSQAANAPGFDAGTLKPLAGAYSPFVLKVSREDGSQRLAAIDTTLPPGLVGKLAGIPE